MPRRGRSRAFIFCALAILVGLVSSQLPGLTTTDLKISVGKTITSSYAAGKLSLDGGTTKIKGAAVSCESLEWNKGDIELEGNGELDLKSWGDVWPCDSCSSPPKIKGGKLNCGTYGKLFVNSRAKVAAESVTVNNGQFQLYEKSELHLRSCNLATPASITGTDDSKAIVAAGATVCKKRLRLNAPCEVQAGGELRSEENGLILVEDKKELRVAGGHLSCSGSCASGTQTNCQVGSDLGKGAKLKFTGPKPSKCSAGVIELKDKSSHEIDEDHECEHVAPCVFTGKGKSEINGKFILSEKLTCDHFETRITEKGHLKIKGKGQLVINAGHTFKCEGHEHEHENCEKESTHIIGCDSCSKPAALECHCLKPGKCKPTVFKEGAKIEIKFKGKTRVKSDAKLLIAGPCEFKGAGEHEVESRGEHECGHESKHSHPKAWFREKSKLKISGNFGKYICAPGHTLALQGAIVYHENIKEQETITIGCDSCGIPAALECYESPSVNEIKGGAKIEIKTQAKVTIKEKAKLQITGPCKFKGNGEFHVESKGEHECKDEARHEEKHCWHKEDTKLIITGAKGKYKCAPGHTLHLKGCEVHRDEDDDKDDDNDHTTIECGDSDNDAVETQIECLPSPKPTVIKEKSCVDLKLKTKFHVVEQAKVDFEGKCRFKGSGKVHIEGKAECKELVEFKAPCEVPHTGEVICSGSKGQVTVTEGKHLEIRGGKCTGDLAASKLSGKGSFCVGEAAGKIETRIKFRASTSSAQPDCKISGGRFEVKASGKIHVEAGAKAVIEKETHFIKAVVVAEGAGSCEVDGHLDCEDSHKSEIHHEIRGEHTLNCAKQHEYTTINYAATAKATCKADNSAGFKAVVVSGRSNLKGRLHIDCGSYRPSAPVKLFDFQAGFSGKFDVCTSSSATLKGHIQTTATAIIWHPTLTTCTGTCTLVS